jgi:hypothetical protein
MGGGGDGMGRQRCGKESMYAGRVHHGGICGTWCEIGGKAHNLRSGQAGRKNE